MEQQTEQILNPLEEVKKAWKAREITAAEIAAACGRTLATVSRALNGLIDPPHSVAMSYYRALLDKRATRAAEAESAAATTNQETETA